MKTGQHWRRGKEEKIKSWIFVSIVLSFWLNLPWEAGLRWWCTWTKSVSYHDLKKTFLSIFLWFIVFCFCSCLFFHQIIFIKSSAISWPTFFLNRINSFQKHYLQDLVLQTVASFQLLLYPKLAFSSSISGKNLPWSEEGITIITMYHIILCGRFAQNSLCLIYLFVDLSKVMFDFSATFIPTVQDWVDVGCLVNAGKEI